MYSKRNKLHIQSFIYTKVAWACTQKVHSENKIKSRHESALMHKGVGAQVNNALIACSALVLAQRSIILFLQSISIQPSYKNVFSLVELVWFLWPVCDCESQRASSALPFLLAQCLCMSHLCQCLDMSHLCFLAPSSLAAKFSSQMDGGPSIAANGHLNWCTQEMVTGSFVCMLISRSVIRDQGACIWPIETICLCDVFSSLSFVYPTESWITLIKTKCLFKQSCRG